MVEVGCYYLTSCNNPQPGTIYLLQIVSVREGQAFYHCWGFCRSFYNDYRIYSCYISGSWLESARRITEDQAEMLKSLYVTPLIVP